MDLRQLLDPEGCTPAEEVMTEPTLNELLAEQGYLKSQIQILTEARNALPRSDKAQAHELLGQISSLQAQEKSLRVPIARAREKEERQEQHSLWCACIVDKYGSEALKECLAWMREERKNRRKRA